MASTVFLDFLIVLGSATLIVTLFHWIRMPSIVAFLCAGVLIGPNGFGLVSTAPEAEILTEIGAILLMFTIGLEFSFGRLKDMRKAILGLGSSQVLVTAILVTGLTHWILDFSWPKAILIGFLTSLSSTATVLKLLSENRDLESPYGQSSLGVLLFQDIAVIPMLLILPLLADQSQATVVTPAAGLKLYLGILAIFFGVWGGSRYVIPFILDRVVHTRNRELFFFCVLFMCFGVAYVVDSLGFSLSLGAFLAGIMISESPYGKQAMSDFTPLRDNFLSFFFISIGMLLDTKFIAAHLLEVFGFLLALVLLKVVILYVIGRMNGYPNATSLVTALILFQVGEFSFLLAESGMSLGLLSETDLQYFLSASVSSLALTPLFYYFAPKMTAGAFYDQWLPINVAKKASKKSKSKKWKETGLHTVIIGYGVAGQDVATALKALKIPFSVIDINPETTKKHQKKGEAFYFGDASKREILEQAGIGSARLAVVTISATKMVAPVLRAIRELRPDLKVVVRAQYLREVRGLSQFENIDLVVAEFETSSEILARTLSHFGVSSKEIHNFLLEARKGFQQSQEKLRDSIRRTIELPTWEALGAIHPVKINKKDFAVGKNLTELNLRQISGSSVVVIYREGFGSTIPNADFIFESGDVAYLIGTAEGIERAEKWLGEGVCAEVI